MSPTTRLCLCRHGWWVLFFFVWPALLQHAICCSLLLMLCVQPCVQPWREKRATSTACEFVFPLKSSCIHARGGASSHCRVQRARPEIDEGFGSLFYDRKQCTEPALALLRSPHKDRPSCISPEGKQRCAKQSPGHSVYGHSISSLLFILNCFHFLPCHVFPSPFFQGPQNEILHICP